MQTHTYNVFLIVPGYLIHSQSFNEFGAIVENTMYHAEGLNLNPCGCKANFLPNTM